MSPEVCPKCGARLSFGMTRTFHPAVAAIPERKFLWMTLDEARPASDEWMERSCYLCRYSERISA